LAKAQDNGVLRFARIVAGQAKGRPGRVSNILWHVTSYFVSNISATVSWIFFRVLNRTTYIGRQHIGREPNTLLLSNHQSMIDSMPIALAAFYPKSWLRPYLVPWHPAARENFFKNKLIAWYSLTRVAYPSDPAAAMCMRCTR
jgi:1-acyl-sn-glycerol-3-phosphate acyltransferase